MTQKEQQQKATNLLNTFLKENALITAYFFFFTNYDVRFDAFKESLIAFKDETIQ